MNVYRKTIERIKLFTDRYPRLRLALGVFLVLVGFLAFITPLTPGSWLALIGLELLGFGVVFKKPSTNNE